MDDDEFINNIDNYTNKINIINESIKNINKDLELKNNIIDKYNKFYLNSVNLNKEYNILINLLLDNDNNNNSNNVLNELKKSTIYNNDILIKLSNYICLIKDKIESETIKLCDNINIISKFKNFISLNFTEDNKKYYEKKLLCTLCYDRQISMCINPCGHTFCSICCNNITNKCFVCRKFVISRIKLFIDNIDNNEDLEEITGIDNNNYEVIDYQ